MKEKQFKEFLNYFRYLELAGSIISNDTLSPKVEHNIQEIDRLINEGYDLLNNALDEIKGNLCTFPKENHEFYLVNIIKGFNRIAPYFNFYLDKKYERKFGKPVAIINSTTFPKSIDNVHKIIKFYVNGFGRYQWNNENKEKCDEYIIVCFRKFIYFFNKLDFILTDLNIDLVKIQHKHELNIVYHNESSPQNKDSKIPAKYYALYHWILIEMGIENKFDLDSNDRYKRSQIEAFANERYPKISKQGFYRAFIEIDITNRPYIAVTFGKEYKEKLIEISNNDAKLIRHLKNYPN